MRSCKRMAVTSLAGLFVLASLWVSSTADAGRLFRLSLENGAFTSGEISAGTDFYSKTITVPVIGDDTATFLYISVSGIIEGQTGTDTGQLSCVVDLMTACNPAGSGFGAGVLPILTLSGAGFQAHAFTYVWCVGPIPSGSHTVDLGLTGLVGTVVLDAVQVSIDASRITQGICTDSF